MRTIPRIRPRDWKARNAPASRPESPRRWWRPLYLAFRAQRRLERITPVTVLAAAPAVPPAIENLSRHIHFHLHEGQRIFTKHAGTREILVAPAPPAKTQGPVPASLKAAPAGDLARAHGRMEERLVSREFVWDRRRVQLDEQTVNARRLLRSRTTERSLHRLSEAAGLAKPSPSAGQPPSTGPRIPRPGLTRTHSPRAFSGRSGATPLDAATMRRTNPTTVAEAHEVPAIRRWARAAAPEPPGPAVALTRQPPVSIVWRQAQPKRETAETRTLQEIAPVQAPNPHPVPSQPSAPPDRVAAPAPAPSVWKLEGPAIDRLAEDVMQRIDKRIRIERERRGM